MTGGAAAVVVVAGLVLSGCASGSSTATSSTTTASSTTDARGGPGGGQGGPGGGGAQCTTPTAAAPAVDASSYAADSSNSEVVTLAKAFAATLTSDQTTSLQQGYSLADAEKWSNLPQQLMQGMSGCGRVGLQTSTLSDAQWAALTALLKAVTSADAGQGWDEISQTLTADDYLSSQDTAGDADAYGRGNYYVAFLGLPSDSGTWELQFGGHHLAVSDTYTDGVLAGATPSFRGVEPEEATSYEGVTISPQSAELAAFQALLASLTPEQLAAAKLAESYNNIVLGPGEDWAFPETSEGLMGSELTADQKQLLMAAVQGMVGDLSAADAETYTTRYEAQLDDTYLGWSGNATLDQEGDYLRIDGPSLWLEFDQQGGAVIKPGIHPHIVWRDKQLDYGGTQPS